MKSFKLFGSVLAGLILLTFAPPVLAGSIPTSDNFNDNIQSSAWGPDQILEGANVFLTEINQHLEFTGNSSSANSSTIIRPWIAGFGSYTQDWDIAADINLGAVTLSQDDSGVKIFLVVADAANPTNNYLTFGLTLERTGGVTERWYETDATWGQSSSSFNLYTLNQNDRVSIVYNSSAKTLGVYCSAGAMRVDDSLIDDRRLISEWDMTASSSFVFALGGGIYGCTNSGHEVWADNFSFTTISNTNIYAGTYSGSYSGDDTGTWQVDVDNSGNALGKAQNSQFWYSVYGNVQADGTMGFVAADDMADFSGQVNASGAVSGTWTSPYVGSGAFSGQRTSNLSTKVIGLSGNLSFGSVVTGQTSAATLTITNSGSAALTVTNISYPACFSGAWSGTVAAGSAANVTVTFAPVAVTNYSGTVTVNSDKTDGINTISVLGAGTDDGDGNGLPDTWEQQFFGGAGVNPSAVCSNGINTVIEAYVAGLNPTNSSARFGITNHTRNLIQWNAVSGRVYNVYWTTNLLAVFQTFETNYTGGAITDSLHSAAGKCFYKIDVRLAP